MLRIKHVPCEVESKAMLFESIVSFILAVCTVDIKNFCIFHTGLRLKIGIKRIHTLVLRRQVLYIPLSLSECSRQPSIGDCIDTEKRVLD